MVGKFAVPSAPQSARLGVVRGRSPQHREPSILNIYIYIQNNTHKPRHETPPREHPFFKTNTQNSSLLVIAFFSLYCFFLFFFFCFFPFVSFVSLFFFFFFFFPFWCAQNLFFFWENPNFVTISHSISGSKKGSIFGAVLGGTPLRPLLNKFFVCFSFIYSSFSRSFSLLFYIFYFFFVIFSP